MAGVTSLVTSVVSGEVTASNSAFIAAPRIPSHTSHKTQGTLSICQVSDNSLYHTSHLILVTSSLWTPFVVVIAKKKETFHWSM